MKSNHPSRGPIGVLALTAAALVSCGDDQPDYIPIERTSALAAAQSNARAAVSGLAESSRSARLVDRLNETLNTTSTTACDQSGSCEQPISVDLEDDFDQVIEELVERVFSASNVYEETDTRITLRLRSGVVCAPEMDEQCVKLLDAVPIFVELTSLAEGNIDARLLVGERRLEVMIVGLHRQEVSVEVNLGPMKSAAQETAAAIDEEDPFADVELRGSLRLSIQETAPLAHVITFGFPSDVFVQASEGEGEWTIEIMAAPAASVLELDGNAKAFRYVAGFNAIDLSFPVIESIDGTCSSSGPCTPPTSKLLAQIGIHLAGLTADVSAREAEDTITMRGVGFGRDAAKLTVGGQPLLALALNPSANWMFDALLEKAGESMKVTVTPSFEAILDLAFENLPEAEDVPAWARNERLTIALDGSPSPSFLVGESESSAGNVVLELLSGTMTMAADHAGTRVVVEAGQCLVEVDSTEDPAPFENLRASVCE